jgi:small subunit ribosomal protein S1
MADLMREWIPGHMPPDEGYWQALLHDGEHAKVDGEAAPSTDGRSQDASPGEEVDFITLDTQDCWQQAQQALDDGKVLELPVIGCNRGGVLVSWNSLRGFVPASHLEDVEPFLSEDDRQLAMQRLIGTNLPLKILELDPDRGRFVLSQRATHVDENRRQKLLNQLCPGDICEGCVTNLCSFGAFVDLDGLEGLIHISELSWGRVDHPSDVLAPGQPLEVYVLNVDRDRGRVGLSLKRLQPDPWQAVEERYEPGQVVEGEVTNVVDFGAFVQVEQGLEGLVHVSEFPSVRFLRPQEVLREGEQVRALVLNVDGHQRRMGLSLRQVPQEGATGELGDGG